MSDRRTDDLLNDPAFLRGLTMRRMSRRDLFRSAGIGAGALSLGAILAACGGTSSGGGAGGGTGGGGGGGGIDWNAKPNGTLNFANWPLYIDKKKVNGQVVYPSLDEFTNDTGIKVNYREAITANADFFGKIQPQLAAGQSTGWDLMVITNGTTLSELLRLKSSSGASYLVELPADKHPNFDKNASAAVTSPAYDPGNKHTMAWQSGLTGIGWDPAQVKQLRPSKPTIDSFQDLLDPAFKGKVGMFADNADLPNLALVGIGINPETSTPDDWQKAADVLQKQKDDGIVRQYYSQNYTSALQNGDTAVTMAWSGDLYQLNAEGDATGLQFTVPNEGAVIWTDNMCIPNGAQNPVDAITYMDYVYQPQIEGLIEDYVAYISPVPSAKEFILNTLHDKTLADSPLVFPSAADLAKTYSYYVFKNSDEENQWNALFQPIYQG
jgi:spermidine/putrescine transport system substrate-binding protein